jgi:peroxiredoxin
MTIRYHISFCLIVIAGFAHSQTVNQRQMDSLIKAHEKEVMGKPLPTFVAAGDAGVVNNDSLKGKVTFINMWEASCAPCMAEMGALNKLYDTLANYPNFQFVSLSADNPETIARIKEKYHVHFPMYHLNEEGCYQLNGGMGYPTSMILDEKANVIYTHSGGFTDSVRIWKYIFSNEVYPEIVKELK